MRWRDHPVPESVQKAIRNIETQYAAPLPIQLLAQRAGLSVRAVARAMLRGDATSCAIATLMAGKSEVRKAETRPQGPTCVTGSSSPAG